MCGIIGYIGTETAAPILIEGLRMQEYRGYDSAGIVAIDRGKFNLRRAAGKLAELEAAIAARPIAGTIGIGHTRWATHGAPSEKNAHPHIAGNVVLVHNGIVENYKQIRDKLTQKGCKFKSETDTEALAQLINYHYKGDLSKAVSRALKEIKGSYAIAAMAVDNPELIVAARQASPLVVGLGDGENYIGSDIPAILQYTRRVILLDDGDMALVTRKGIECLRADGLKPVRRKVKTVEWDAEMARKDGYPHFMLKEIFQQSESVAETIRGRIDAAAGKVNLPDLTLDLPYLRSLKKINIIACGTSYHAGMVARTLIERSARIPVEVHLSSEFRYSDPLVDKHTLIIAISQSGETADTLAALGEAKARRAKILSICNVVDSSIARASDFVLYTQAGPEIGVASTKAFTTQVVVLSLTAIRLGRLLRKISAVQEKEFVRQLAALPKLIKKQLAEVDEIKKIAKKYQGADNFLYLGRGINVPIALEGALKLKEISYIHAEGYPAGEMKHGPIALIDKNLPVVCLVNQTEGYDKMVSNMEEVLARGGRVIALANPGDRRIARQAEDVIRVRKTHPALEPIINVLPLQLLAYYIADYRGLDIDQPRNLAKSVTVE